MFLLFLMLEHVAITHDQSMRFGDNTYALEYVPLTLLCENRVIRVLVSSLLLRARRDSPERGSIY